MSFTTYFGFGSGFGGLSGAPTTARDSFLAALNNTVTSNGFEDVFVGVPPPWDVTNAKPSGVVTTTIDGANGTATDSGIAGRYNTTPGGLVFLTFRESVALATVATLTFSEPVAAVGFFVVDPCEQNATNEFSVRLTRSAGGTVDVPIINSGTSPPPPYANGSSFFFGFVDSASTYTQLEFRSVNGVATDAWALDDLIVAVASQVMITGQGGNLLLPKLQFAGGRFRGATAGLLPALVGNVLPNPPRFWTGYRRSREIP